MAYFPVLGTFTFHASNACVVVMSNDHHAMTATSSSANNSYSTTEHITPSVFHTRRHAVPCMQELGYSMQAILPDVMTGAAQAPVAEAPIDESNIPPVEAPSSAALPSVDYVGDGPEVDTDYTVAVTPSGIQSGPRTNQSGHARQPGTNQSGLAPERGGELSPAASSNDGGLIIGLSVSVALMLCLIAAAATFVIVRRKRQSPSIGGSTNPSGAAARPPGADKPAVFEEQSEGDNGVQSQQHPRAPHQLPPQCEDTLTGQDRQPRLTHSHTLPPQPLQHRVSAGETFSQNHIALPVPPVGTGLTSTVVSAQTDSMVSSSAGKGSAHALHSGGAHSAHSAHSAVASVAANKRRLQHELVRMCDGEELFMGAYRVLSPQEQRVGGQGVVQFMRWARTEEPVAVKFFLSQATFDEEMQLYAEESLRSMMPVMREAMRAGQVRRSSGYVFPAFAVLERGESLQDWRRNVLPQTATVVDVRALLTCMYPCRLSTSVSLSAARGC